MPDENQEQPMNDSKKWSATEAVESTYVVLDALLSVEVEEWDLIDVRETLFSEYLKLRDAHARYLVREGTVTPRAGVAGPGMPHVSFGRSEWLTAMRARAMKPCRKCGASLGGDSEFLAQRIHQAAEYVRTLPPGEEIGQPASGLAFMLLSIEAAYRQVKAGGSQP